MPLTHSVAKVTGADVELGNFIQGIPGLTDTGALASRLLLGAVDGVRVGTRAPTAGGTWNPQDWGRTYLPEQGSCVYVDMEHLEICLPETLSAWDHVAAWHAMLGVARQAMQWTTAGLPDGQRVHVLANNSDGRSHSWGGHLNVLVTRAAWDRIFHRRLQDLLVLATHQASSIVYTGQGKCGSENGTPPVPYQLAQRADFIESLVGWQTTCNRPIVNSRDEALAAPDLARVHCIFFDTTLCDTAVLLKVGTMQIVLAMLEAGEVDTRLILDDPVAAVRAWSHDPSLRARAALLSGDAYTAVEVQLRLLEHAARFVEAGRCDGLVPGAQAIVALWGDTLAMLERRDLGGLVGRLDWVTKLDLLEAAIAREPGLDWDSPDLKYYDHLWSSLDAEDGLYWRLARLGGIERQVSEAAVARMRVDPPPDTRAWTRAYLLRAAPDAIVDADWHQVSVRDGRGRVRRVDLPHPLRHGRDQTAPLVQGATSLDALLDRLGARDVSTTHGSNHSQGGPRNAMA